MLGRNIHKSRCVRKARITIKYENSKQKVGLRIPNWIPNIFSLFITERERERERNTERKVKKKYFSICIFLSLGSPFINRIVCKAENSQRFHAALQGRLEGASGNFSLQTDFLTTVAITYMQGKSII